MSSHLCIVNITFQKFEWPKLTHSFSARTKKWDTYPLSILRAEIPYFLAVNPPTRITPPHIASPFWYTDGPSKRIDILAIDVVCGLLQSTQKFTGMRAQLSCNLFKYFLLHFDKWATKMVRRGIYKIIDLHVDLCIIFLKTLNIINCNWMWILRVFFVFFTSQVPKMSLSTTITRPTACINSPSR